MSSTWDGLPISTEPPFGTAVCVWRERDGTLEWLVLHRAHHGPEYEGEWAWTPPTGARLPNEPPEECARRELREETGLELEPTLVDASGDWSVWVAQAPPDAEVVLDAEHDRYEWLPLEEAAERCLPASVAEGLKLVAQSH